MNQNKHCLPSGWSCNNTNSNDTKTTSLQSNDKTIARNRRVMDGRKIQLKQQAIVCCSHLNANDKYSFAVNHNDNIHVLSLIPSFTWPLLFLLLLLFLPAETIAETSSSDLNKIQGQSTTSDSFVEVIDLSSRNNTDNNNNNNYNNNKMETRANSSSLPPQITNPAKVERLTQKSGCPIGDKLNSLLLGAKGPNLLADVVFLEENAHFNRERIPERVVHAKGGAAFGQFTVTNTEISKYSKASLWTNYGKKTPIAIRFSHVTGESGIADTPRDVRGFAIKFYTETGNWDLVGNNLPVFFIRDPINFPSFIHSQKRNPKTHLRDNDAFWDFISLLPETMHTVCMLFSDRGTPDGFRHMHGYGVNTFKLINSKNEAFYAKFHWTTNQTIRNLNDGQATKLAGSDPDYSIRDLYVNINQGYYPSWTLKFQVMSSSEAEQVGEKEFNPFDVTKTWPTARWPLIEIGKLTLNKNPDDYFGQVEQLAFCPANMIPGIEPSPDRMLVGRMLAYTDAQRYRMGVNFADLPVNKPRCPVMTPTYCDGSTNFCNLPGLLPNYVPSIKYKNLKLYDEQFAEHKQPFAGHVGRFDLSKDDNFSQARILVTKVLNKESRDRLAQNVAGHLKYVLNKEITTRVLAQFREIDADLSASIEKGMTKMVATPTGTSTQKPRSVRSPK